MERLKMSRMLLFVMLTLFICAFLSGCEKKGNGNESTSTGQTQAQSDSGSTSPIVPPPRPDDYNVDNSDEILTGNATLKITAQNCKEGFVLNLMQELKDGSKIADWNAIKKAFDNKLPEELDRVGLGDKQAAWVTVNKREYWGGKRHYFIQRFDNGKPSDFLAHDQVGNIYLGSWYDIELPILITIPVR